MLIFCVKIPVKEVIYFLPQEMFKSVKSLLLSKLTLKSQFCDNQINNSLIHSICYIYYIFLFMTKAIKIC